MLKGSQNSSEIYVSFTGNIEQGNSFLPDHTPEASLDHPEQWIVWRQQHR